MLNANVGQLILSSWLALFAAHGCDPRPLNDESANSRVIVESITTDLQRSLIGDRKGDSSAVAFINASGVILEGDAIKCNEILPELAKQLDAIRDKQGRILFRVHYHASVAESANAVQMLGLAMMGYAGVIGFDDASFITTISNEPLNWDKY